MSGKERILVVEWRSNSGCLMSQHTTFISPRMSGSARSDQSAGHVKPLDLCYTTLYRVRQKKYNPTENVISSSIHNIFAQYFKGL